MTMSCNNHNFEYAKKLKSNGDYFIKKQCFKCGESISSQCKFLDIGGKNKLHLIRDFDEDLNNSFYELKREVKIEMRKEEILKHTKKYYEYLESDLWKLKRKYVLKRDNNICQACLSAEANDVHHLTYNRVFDEPLFDLISVCRNCHKKIHNK